MFVEPAESADVLRKLTVSMNRHLAVSEHVRDYKVSSSIVATLMNVATMDSSQELMRRSPFIIAAGVLTRKIQMTGIVASQLYDVMASATDTFRREMCTWMSIGTLVMCAEYGGGRIVDAESRIIRSLSWALQYARAVIHDRWEVYENAADVSDADATMYHMLYTVEIANSEWYLGNMLVERNIEQLLPSIMSGYSILEHHKRVHAEGTRWCRRWPEFETAVLNLRNVQLRSVEQLQLLIKTYMLTIPPGSWPTGTILLEQLGSYCD